MINAAPRTVSTSSIELTLIVLGALTLISPVATASALVAVYLVARSRRFHWWQIAGVLAVLLGIVWVVVGLCVGDLTTGPLRWQLANAVITHFRDQLLLHLALSAVLGVPVGAATGAGLIGLEESRAGRAEWHPMEQRRRVVARNHRLRRLEKLLEGGVDGELESPAIGIALEGGLRGWQEGQWAVMPAEFRGLGMAFVGGSGSGKTKAVVRCAWARATLGSKVFFADCKGTDPTLPAEILASVHEANPGAQHALWPARPIDMWRGTPPEVASKLLSVVDTSESAYYGAATETIVRLVCGAPEGPVRSSQEFLRRLDLRYLLAAYKGSADVAAVDVLKDDPKAVAGVRLRYHGFFDALAGLFDGDWSFEDVDAAVFCAPSLAAPKDADAAMRMLLADYAHYCAARKERIGEDSMLVIDEFSAIKGAAPLVTNLAERVRDVGGQIVVTAQSWHGLGDDDDERRRLAGAVGAVVVQRTPYPDELVTLAGTVRATEQSWQLDDGGSSGMGNLKMGHKLSLDPDQVRRAGVGDAWIIRNGEWLYLRVVPVPYRDNSLLLAHEELQTIYARPMPRKPDVLPGFVQLGRVETLRVLE